MYKPKTTIAGRLENRSGEWTRTYDLRIMSPGSCPARMPGATWGAHNFLPSAWKFGLCLSPDQLTSMTDSTPGWVSWRNMAFMRSAE
jgi:hypothetical protein